jgi:predicted ABC-type ATPase
MPTLYIIAGPNGVGKTTFAKDFLPSEVQCLEFVNADLIAQGLSPFAPEKESMQAGRLMLKRLQTLLERRESFSFETTLSGRGYMNFLRESRQAGYEILLDFLWVPTLHLSQNRVVQRVRKGGHHIPLEVQQRRFHLGLRNLFSIYRPLVDHWRIFNNSAPSPLCVAEEKQGELLIHLPETFDIIQAQL